MTNRGEVPTLILVLLPGQEADSNFLRTALPESSRVVAEYEGLGGSRYRSTMTIEEQKWVENFRFEEL
jgi:hypothetical protein